LLSLIMLILLTLMALTSMNSSQLDDRMAANTREREIAFLSAEAALSRGEKFILEKALNDADFVSCIENASASVSGNCGNACSYNGLYAKGCTEFVDPWLHGPNAGPWADSGGVSVRLDDSDLALPIHTDSSGTVTHLLEANRPRYAIQYGGRNSSGAHFFNVYARGRGAGQDANVILSSTFALTGYYTGCTEFMAGEGVNWNLNGGNPFLWKGPSDWEAVTVADLKGAYTASHGVLIIPVDVVTPVAEAATTDAYDWNVKHGICVADSRQIRGPNGKNMVIESNGFVEIGNIELLSGGCLRVNAERIHARDATIDASGGTGSVILNSNWIDFSGTNATPGTNIQAMSTGKIVIKSTGANALILFNDYTYFVDTASLDMDVYYSNPQQNFDGDGRDPALVFYENAAEVTGQTCEIP
jgi:Tfp pilus assembly protein PilX